MLSKYFLVLLVFFTFSLLVECACGAKSAEHGATNVKLDEIKIVRMKEGKQRYT